MRAAVKDVDVAEPLPAIPDVAGQAWVLVRAFTEPLGHVLVDLPVSPDELAAAIEAELGEPIRARLAGGSAAGLAGAGGSAAGLAGAGGSAARLDAGGVRASSTPDYLATRERVLRDAPSITVVICTRDRPEMLDRCLTSLREQEYPKFRVLVVDNAPRDDATERVVSRQAGHLTINRIVAPRPGLSRARNAAMAAAPGQILAYLDDDAEPDRYWLAEVARALAEHPTADAVSGAIVPAALETDAQMWFERYGGHSKGRGFAPDVFSPDTAHRQDPLYPLPPFGAGGNMVFRPGVLERLGGFDEALGAGTPALGSEDTHAFMRLLQAGGTVVYRPSAFVRHHSRPDAPGLRRQMFGYGAGLTAAYTSLLLARPWLFFRLLRLVPSALRDLRSGSGRRLAGIGADFPPDLLAANRRGMLYGPIAYLRGLYRRDARSARAA